MDNHVFDGLSAVLMVFFAVVGFNAVVDSATLLDSFTGVIGLVFSGVFGLMLASRFGHVKKAIAKADEVITATAEK